MKRLFLFLFLFTVHYSLFTFIGCSKPTSPQGKVVGTVTDDQNHKSLGGVIVVYSENMVKSATTDSSGKYTIVVPTGNHKLSFSKEGYDGKIVDVHVSSATATAMATRSLALSKIG